MGHSLELKVVAEGIERPDQLAELHRLDCEVGQGYLFGKPMESSDLAAYLRKTPSQQAA